MDTDYCRRIIQACFPALPVHKVTFLAEGWDSTVWEVNGCYIFRFPKRAEVEQGLRKEIRLLPLLAHGLPLEVPRFDYIWQGGPAYRGVFVGYPKIPGEPMTQEHVAATGLGKSAHQLGEFLTTLHCLPLHQIVACGIPASSPLQWRQQYRALYETVQQRIFPLLEGPEQHNLAAAWEDFVENEDNFHFASVLIHADLNGEHILFDAKRGCITGIIDWEDAMIGDPALDFAGLLDFGPEFARRVLDAYHGLADRELLVRARFYHAIAPCYEVLFGLNIGMEQHVAAGLSSLRKIWSTVESPL